MIDLQCVQYQAAASNLQPHFIFIVVCIVNSEHCPPYMDIYHDRCATAVILNFRL